MYEILEVAPSASLPEIQAAHRRLSRNLMLGKLGLSREDIQNNLKLIDWALQTLSDQSSRDAYDAQLATRIAPKNAVVPVTDGAMPLKLAAAIQQTYKATAAIETGPESPLGIISATAASSASALTKIFRVLVGLFALSAVVKCSTMILASHQPGRAPEAVSKAQEKVIIQEYYQTHGVRPGSKAEADLLEVENRRRENAQREAAREKEQEERKYHRFVEESRQLADQVSENIRRDEERARYEEERKRQYAEQARRQKEEAEREAERIRLEEAWRKFGREPPRQ